MSENVEQALSRFLRGLSKRNAYQLEFRQAVHEVASSIMPWYLEHESYQQAQILERLTEPDRVVSFRVSWQTDAGEIRANRAWRVQFSNALGPYKGGLRFHPSVDESVLKFLGFEQVLKNSLTGLPMGGAKGGSNFNPKGKSDNEVMRFCQSLMTELYHYIGEDVDVPAGDIGVGAREIGYLFGQYMRLENRWAGVLTGKAASFGGSALRTEATGYGCVYFLEHVLGQHDKVLAGQRVAVSGSGNVALYAAQKLVEKDAQVVTLSDSGGFLHFEDGLTADQLAELIELKEVKRGRLSEFEDAGVVHHPKQRPWATACDIALPCATQNEIEEEDAKALIDSGVVAVCEGANMPTTDEAARRFRNAGVLHAPGKAANAGGVAVSGLEQSQNAIRTSWTREDVDARLKEIMSDIHSRCVQDGAGDGEVIDYVKGANIAGFRRVADTLLRYGVV